MTDDRGAYQFTRLVPGSYTVRAPAAGIPHGSSSENIVVKADAPARADLRLEVGALEETLTVTGGARSWTRRRASQQTVITREELEPAAEPD